MKRHNFNALLTLLLLLLASGNLPAQTNDTQITLRSKHLVVPLKLDKLFYETAQGRTYLRTGPDAPPLPDGRTVQITFASEGDNYAMRLNAQPNADILKWGFEIDALPDEYFTGIMERVVDGPQAASWAAGIKPAMNLRGQKVEMIIKPTTSVYAPFYLSSRGYAVLAKTNWPGHYDFAASDPQRVKIEFEGPSLELKIYTAKDPATLVKAHALDAGPPFMPPKWMFTSWRWRDEHTQREKYYDGTPVNGPFNSELMEDVLMMRAYGIPNGIQWIDRPWGPGKPWGYDDFEIDEKRLPNFGKMVKWLESQDIKLVLWIAPFYQGKMAEEAQAKGYTLAGQVRPANGNNYPMVDMTNPDAKAYWQSGIEKLLRLGVAGFKLDRAEEDIPEEGPYKVFDGRSIRENRNAYPAMYTKAVYDVAQKHRGQDFFLMPRAAYTGSSQYAVFWGGDVGGTQEGLRASIVGLLRSAVMGYPHWGSDICGYNQQLTETEVCGRWLAFGAFNPIMEVGPTRNLAFWNLNREPSYDATLIALWRMYARLHHRLIEYGYRHAQEATKTGMPIARPLFLVDPQAQAAWENWWTYLYGADIVVSPVWAKGQRAQQVYLPSGAKWRDAWTGKTHNGGQTVTVAAEPHQIPIFIRAGAKIDLGNLNKEWLEAQAVAQKRPDLKALDAETKAWLEKNRE